MPDLASPNVMTHYCAECGTKGCVAAVRKSIDRVAAERDRLRAALESIHRDAGTWRDGDDRESPTTAACHWNDVGRRAALTVEEALKA